MLLCCFGYVKAIQAYQMCCSCSNNSVQCCWCFKRGSEGYMQAAKCVGCPLPQVANDASGNCNGWLASLGRRPPRASAASPVRSKLAVEWLTSSLDGLLDPNYTAKELG